MAEREGFEPPIRLPVCRISSAVHSTTLPPLRGCEGRAPAVDWYVSKHKQRYKGATWTYKLATELAVHRTRAAVTQEALSQAHCLVLCRREITAPRVVTAQAATSIWIGVTALKPP